MNLFPIEHQGTMSRSAWLSAIAESHCDQHLAKQCLELWQMLNTSCNVLGIKTDNPSKAYVNHPVTKWVRSSLENWQFSIDLAEALAVELQTKNNKPLHKSYVRIMDNIPYDANGKIKSLGLQEFACAMPDDIVKRNTNSVDAYKEYYQLNKSWFARKKRGTVDKYEVYPSTWNNRNKPEWFTRLPLTQALASGKVQAWQGSKRIILSAKDVTNINDYI